MGRQDAPGFLCHELSHSLLLACSLLLFTQYELPCLAPGLAARTWQYQSRNRCNKAQTQFKIQILELLLCWHWPDPNPWLGSRLFQTRKQSECLDLVSFQQLPLPPSLHPPAACAGFPLQGSGTAAAQRVEPHLQKPLHHPLLWGKGCSSATDFLVGPNQQLPCLPFAALRTQQSDLPASGTTREQPGPGSLVGSL